MHVFFLKKDSAKTAQESYFDTHIVVSTVH